MNFEYKHEFFDRTYTTREAYARVWQYARKYKFRLAMGVVCGMLTAGTLVPLFQVVQPALDKVSAKAEEMGVSIETVGDMKSMSDSMSVFGMAIMLSIILMYLSLVILYNNWVDPLVVMFSIPFSIFGAILALALSATSLNIYAMLGLVMLIGLVAKNAILLVDFANESVKKGLAVNDALVEAVKLRTRPILMTALSTIIGMIPVALASGSSAELRNGIGWVIIGGMTLSTLLTLIVVPVVYRLFHRKIK